MNTLALVVLASAASFCAALHLVGYSVRGGLHHIWRLWLYRRGLCRCALCRE